MFSLQSYLDRDLVTLTIHSELYLEEGLSIPGQRKMISASVRFRPVEACSVVERRQTTSRKSLRLIVHDDEPEFVKAMTARQCWHDVEWRWSTEG